MWAWRCVRAPTRGCAPASAGCVKINCLPYDIYRQFDSYLCGSFIHSCVCVLMCVCVLVCVCNSIFVRISITSLYLL